MDKEKVLNNHYQDAVKDLSSTILEDGDVWYSYIYYLPVHLQVAYTIGILHKQVANGGLHQYFVNGYGQFAYLTIDNLKLIKAFRSADILKRALDIVNEEQYSIDEFRKKVFSKQLDRLLDDDEELENFLDELDDEYYESDEDLTALYVDYLKSVNS